MCLVAWPATIESFVPNLHSRKNIKSRWCRLQCILASPLVGVAAYARPDERGSERGGYTFPFFFLFLLFSCEIDFFPFASLIME